MTALSDARTQRLATEEVQVGMADPLPGVPAVVPNEAVPRLDQPPLGCQLASNLCRGPD